MRARELRAITEDIAGPLEHGLLKEVQFTEFLGPELQLRYSLCGLATAALQRYLAERHNVPTTRVIVDLPEGSSDLQTRHVFLRHDGHISVDPTYSQFFDYAGLSAIDVSLDTSLSSLYPDEKILVLEDQKADDFIADYAVQALAAGRAIGNTEAPTMDELQTIYRQIWQPKTCRRFPAGQDAMVDRLVARMAEGNN